MDFLLLSRAICFHNHCHVRLTAYRSHNVVLSMRWIERKKLLAPLALNRIGHNVVLSMR